MYLQSKLCNMLSFSNNLGSVLLWLFMCKLFYRIHMLYGISLSLNIIVSGEWGSKT